MTVAFSLRPSRSTTAPPTVNLSDAVLAGRLSSPRSSLPLVNRNVYTELSLDRASWPIAASVTSNPSAPQFTLDCLRSCPDQRLARLRQRNRRFLSEWRNNITGMRNYGNRLPTPTQSKRPRRYHSFAAEYGQFSAPWSRLSPSREQTSSTAVCSISTAIPTSKHIRGASRTYLQGPIPPQQFGGTSAPHQARQVLLLLQLCRPAPGTRRKRSQALRCPRLPSAWATLPRTRPSPPLFTRRANRTLPRTW